MKALRGCTDPSDEDVVCGVLEGVLVVPALSVQAAAAEYSKLLGENGYASVPALR